MLPEKLREFRAIEWGNEEEEFSLEEYAALRHTLEHDLQLKVKQLGLYSDPTGKLVSKVVDYTSPEDDKLTSWNKLCSQSCSPYLRHLLEDDSCSPVVCYDFRNELEAMKSHLLALSKFTICLAHGFTYNLRSFVVLLHDYPLKVEKTEIYSLLKKWRTPADVREGIETH